MTNRSRPAGRALLALSLLTAATLPLFGTTTASAESTALAGLPYADALPTRGELAQSLAELSGTSAVFVQFDGTSALDVAMTTSGDAPVTTRVAEIDSTAEAVSDQVERQDDDTEVLYVSRYTVPGVALQADSAALQTLIDNPAVVSVSPIVLRDTGTPQVADPANASSDAFTQALQVWQQTGHTGQDVNVAVLDTGLDYTHTDFGGPGTAAAYAAALSTTSAPDSTLMDPDKYLGGYDFAGPTYNASPVVESSYDPVPAPDENPIDGPGGNHGTHVAGTAVGYGVLADGTTFDGDYSALDETALDDFQVGPGSAPGAGIYALKVFGDNGGSTALTGAALDWVGEQIANGVRIDVINMSLGTDFGAPDDPESAKVQALMDYGVLPVLAAGNAGDITDVAGSPGSAARSLAVAATSSGNVVQDAFDAVAPADVTGTYAGQYSQNYRLSGATGAVVALTDPTNTDGCATFATDDAAAVAGNVVWLEWDEANLECGSATRFGHAFDAGAIGVLLTSTGNTFEAGIAGDYATPGLQMTAETTAALRPALEAGTLEVALDPSRTGEVSRNDPNLADTIASFTSRGLHGSYDQVVKPDVAAPGVSIVSAANGTGSDSVVLSGTSMASPLVAGIAALVVETHRDWSVDQVKAGIMNTSVHDITSGGADRTPYGPARVGVGRVDAAAAVANQVTVASQENEGLVTGSFGVVEVGAEPVSLTRTLTVTNSGTQTQTFGLDYLPRTEMPGVSYLLGQDSVTVAAGGTASFTVTLSIPDPTALRRTLDPTMSDVLGGVARQYVADASGVIALDPADAIVQPPLRVAVFVAPKPVSETDGSDVSFTGDADASTMAIVGRGVDQGSGSAGYSSLMAPFQLGVEDPDDTFDPELADTTLDSTDIRAVGASTTAPQLADPSQGVLSFGIDMDGDWNRLSPFSSPLVEIDVNGDELVDFITTYSVDTETDSATALTYDASTDQILDSRPVNGFDASTDTNQFDNDVLVLPVSLSALGYTADTTDTQLTYRVSTQSVYAPGNAEEPADYLVDETDSARFDVYTPDVWFGDPGQTGAGTGIYRDGQGTLAVHRTGDVTTSADGVSVLLLHLHGAEGERSEVLSLLEAAPPTTAPPTTAPPTTAPPTTVPPGTEMPVPGVPSEPTSSSSPGGGGQSGAGGVDDDLASTGSELLPWLLIGAALVTGGAATMWASRRRRAAAPGQVGS